MFFFFFFPLFFFVLSFLFFSDIRIHEKTLSESCFRGVLADFLFFFAPRLFLRREVQGQNRKTNKPKHIEGRRKRKKKREKKEKKQKKRSLFFAAVSLFFLLPLFPAFFSSSSLFLCGSLSDVGGVFLFSSSSLPFFVPTCAFFVLFLFFLKLERHKNADKGAKKRVCEERKEESTLSFLPLIFSK